MYQDVYPLQCSPAKKMKISLLKGGRDTGPAC